MHFSNFVSTIQINNFLILIFLYGIRPLWLNILALQFICDLAHYNPYQGACVQVSSLLPFQDQFPANVHQRVSGEDFGTQIPATYVQYLNSIPATWLHRGSSLDAMYMWRLSKQNTSLTLCFKQNL